MNKKRVKKIIGLALIAAVTGTSVINANTINVATASDVAEDTKISKEIDTTSDELVSIIVEFVSEPTAVASKQKAYSLKSAESAVKKDHETFEAFLAKTPKAYSAVAPTIKYSYETVFNGVSMQIKGTEVANLLNSGVVKRIHKTNTVHVDTGALEATEKSVEDSDANNKNSRMVDTVPYLGVDGLHNEGVDGEGIKVGVLDTGIDYNHPDLKNAYKGFRAEDGDEHNQDIDATIGWDFIDNDANPMESTYKDWKESGLPEIHPEYGSKYYTAHGTHVSGTIGARGENPDSAFKVVGIAPKADIYGYRVLGPYGYGENDGIIAAIEKAVTDGMDVINMSLGDSDINDPFDPMTTAVNNATEAGVVTVISNGNSGPGPETVGSPGTSQLPIAVGASTIDNKRELYNVNAKVEGADALNIAGEVILKDLEVSFNEYDGKEYEFVYCGIGTPEDFEGKDLTGKVAVIDRGDIALVDKSINAKENGAVLTILVNTSDDTRVPYLGEMIATNTIAVQKTVGDQLKNNPNAKISVGKTGEELIKGDELTDFSSVGPVKGTYDIRPDLIAPGSQVFSTVPEYINDRNDDVDNYAAAYQRMSGTSMAAPHVAGIAALILQANPEYTPEDVKAAMMNTSEHLHRKDGVSYSVHEIGAGRVNPVEAVKEKVSFKATYDVLAGENKETIENVTGMLSYAKLVIDNEGGAEKTIPVTVENNTSEAKTYSIQVEYSDSPRAKDAAKNGVNLTLPTEVTVEANGTATFDVTINVPATVQLGNYEGYIHINDTNGDEDYQLPFGTTVKSAVVEKVTGLNSKVTNNSASIVWNEPSSKAELEGYVIYKDGKEIANVPVGTTSYEIEGLKANTIYGVKVTAKYSHKESKPASVNIRTAK
ncbi:S8 family serine peptidase [Clostridium sp.]|uniref:S8 family serine peptidase n=1 Tax=Clostridium sp. TaxID=1506 RepID=UPI003F3966E1